MLSGSRPGVNFYRREWAYACRHLDGFSLPKDQDKFLAEQSDCTGVSDFFSHNAYDPMRELLASLPKSDRSLLEDLYVHERSEASIGRRLGIGRRAVNKRKHSALQTLRRSFL